MDSIIASPASVSAQTRITARWPFVITICLGSFLLFLVQPMVARMALPRLGGAPAVWNSAMLVYQALLLGGYAYADWLGRLAARRQAWVHLALFVVAALTLPVHLFSGSLPADTSPFLWVPWLLLGSIGPLFFIVSAQAPLMQRWFSLSGGADPYPLYAASNLGSFAGLIAYPLLVEPNFAVVTQRWLWSGGYLLLLVIVGLVGLNLPRGAASGPVVAVRTPAPGARQMLNWIILAAVPSGLMLSTSLHLTTDIMAMPLLWVLPLGLYLLSFSIAFAEKRGLANGLSRIAPIFLLFAACGVFVDSTDWPILFAFLSLANLLIIATTLHARMYATRPDPAHLTRFYLAMSIGGAVGGLFGALIAPLIFSWTYEYPLLLLAAGALLVPRGMFDLADRFWAPSKRALIGTSALVVVVLATSLVAGSLEGSADAARVKGIAASIIIFVAIFSFGNRRVYVASLLALMLCLNGWEKLALSAEGRITRSFFGVYSVRDVAGQQRSLVHGTTVHGIQSLVPGHEATPTTYYAPLSGIGLAMRMAPALFGDHARIGVVGLGSGTLSCYAKPGQHWRFYEIDPAIVAIASDPKRFTFLSHCLPNPEIVMGDARLSLSASPPGQTDILAIDAFSSDSVPMHLLTEEAFAAYRRQLSPGGLLMVHISNRMLDLGPVVAEAASRGGWSAVQRYYIPTPSEKAQLYSASIWVAMSPSRGVIDRLHASNPEAGWQPLARRPGFSDWTDDFASILPLVKWRKRD
jgi:spermidine synthase